LGFITESVKTALALIVSLNGEVFSAVWTSLSVAGWSISFAAVLGIPVGVAVGLREFPLKRAVMTVMNTLMGIPTVVIGILVYSFLSRRGPLGGYGFLFTPKAMIIGQTLLAIPVVANYAVTAIKDADPRILPTAMTLGAGRRQSMTQLLREARFGVMAAVVAGFGRVISEVGAAMMVGGNIRLYTRTMTTAIALETSKGEYATGVALGIILMSVTLLVNVLLSVLQQGRQP
jgi:tungstate transport system permease protein